jgi:hypothetical protein
MRLPFAAVHESESGTERTNCAGAMMSVVRGRPEVAFRAVRIAIDPRPTCHDLPLE